MKPDPNGFQEEVGWEVHYLEGSRDTFPELLPDPTLSRISLERKTQNFSHSCKWSCRREALKSRTLLAEAASIWSEKKWGHCMKRFLVPTSILIRPVERRKDILTGTISTLYCFACLITTHPSGERWFGFRQQGELDRQDRQHVS